MDSHTMSERPRRRLKGRPSVPPPPPARSVFDGCIRSGVVGVVRVLASSLVGQRSRRRTKRGEGSGRRRALICFPPMRLLSGRNSEHARCLSLSSFHSSSLSPHSSRVFEGSWLIFSTLERGASRKVKTSFKKRIHLRRRSA